LGMGEGKEPVGQEKESISYEINLFLHMKLIYSFILNSFIFFILISFIYIKIIFPTIVDKSFFWRKYQPLNDDVD